MLRIALRIVSAESVRPHEIADPVRENRIENRLREDGLLRDPLVVGEVNGLDGYVLLDGTNRKRALAAMGLPHLLVQTIDYADEHAVQLRSWAHAAQQPLETLKLRVGSVPDVTLQQVPELGATDALREPRTLALLLNAQEQYAVVRSPDAGSPAHQLRELVDLYERSMTRVDFSAENVEERAQSLPEDSTLVAFPGFSRSQVVTMAMRGSLIPAGITRHVVQIGRALRVNVPLEMLAGDDLDAAGRALELHLETLQPRNYDEPTVLFDS